MRRDVRSSVVLTSFRLGEPFQAPCRVLTSRTHRTARDGHPTEPSMAPNFPPSRAPAPRPVTPPASRSKHSTYAGPLPWAPNGATRLDGRAQRLSKTAKRGLVSYRAWGADVNPAAASPGKCVGRFNNWFIGWPSFTSLVCCRTGLGLLALAEVQRPAISGLASWATEDSHGYEHLADILSGRGWPPGTDRDRAD